MANYLIHRQLFKYSLFIYNKPYFVGDIILVQGGIIADQTPYALTQIDFNTIQNITLDFIGKYVTKINNNSFTVSNTDIVEIRLLYTDPITQDISLLDNKFLRIYNQHNPISDNLYNIMVADIPLAMNAKGIMGKDLQATSEIIYKLYDHYNNLVYAVCPFYSTSYSNTILSYFLADLPIDVNTIADKQMMLRWCFSNLCDMYNSKISLLYKLCWFLYAWTGEKIGVSFNITSVANPSKTFILDDNPSNHNVLEKNIYVQAEATNNNFLIERSSKYDDKTIIMVMNLLIKKLCDINTLYGFSDIEIVPNFFNYGYTLDLGYYYINNPMYIDPLYSIAMRWDNNLSLVKVNAKSAIGDYSAIAIVENSSNYPKAKTFLTAKLTYLNSTVTTILSLSLCEVIPRANNFHSYIINGYVIIPVGSPSFSETYDISWLNSDNTFISTTYTITHTVLLAYPKNKIKKNRKKNDYNSNE